MNVKTVKCLFHVTMLHLGAKNNAHIETNKMTVTTFKRMKMTIAHIVPVFQVTLGKTKYYILIIKFIQIKTSY